MRARTRLTFAFLFGPALACADRDLDQSWAAGEARSVYPSPANLPSIDGEGRTLAVALPLGVPPRMLALDARDALVLGKDASIVEPRGVEHAVPEWAMVASLGSVSLDEGSRVGSVYAFGTGAPELAPSALVGGYVKSLVAARSVQAKSVRWGLLDGVEPYVEEFRWYVDFPLATHGDRASRTAGAAPIDLAPGAYANVIVESGSTAVIHAGRYTFESLDIREGGTLDLDNTEGPIDVWVHRSLAMNGRMLDYVLQPNVLVGYSGRTPPTLSGSFRATLVAPDAEVRLPTTREPHAGAFFARTITVADGAVVEHRAFSTTTRVEPLPYVCRRCDLAAREVVRECCNELDRARSAATAVARSCIADCALGESPSCAADCALSSTQSATDAQLELDECMTKTASAQDACSHRYGYRPDTCAKLGYRAPLIESCF